MCMILFLQNTYFLCADCEYEKDKVTKMFARTYFRNKCHRYFHFLCRFWIKPKTTSGRTVISAEQNDTKYIFLKARVDQLYSKFTCRCSKVLATFVCFRTFAKVYRFRENSSKAKKCRSMLCGLNLGVHQKWTVSQ